MKYAPPLGEAENASYTDGNPEHGILGSVVPAEAIESPQRELVKVIQEAGLEPDDNDLTQLWQAIVKIISVKVPLATVAMPGVMSPDGKTCEADSKGVLSVLLATSARAGIMRPDGTSCKVDGAGVLSVSVRAAYLTEFRNFFEQSPPLGWAARNGAVLENADSAYPALWAALHEEKNAWKCKTLEEWSALSNAAGGIGGAPFFVLDENAKTVKLPDTRGDYERGAGSGYLSAVGAWHGDAIRNLTGTVSNVQNNFSPSGMFYIQDQNGMGNYYGGHSRVACNAARIVPTASENRVRTYAVLPCVYLGGND